MYHRAYEIDGKIYDVNCNSDWSGEALVSWTLSPLTKGDDGSRFEVRIPGKLLQAIGRNATLSEVISKVENMFSKGES